MHGFGLEPTATASAWIGLVVYDIPVNSKPHFLGFENTSRREGAGSQIRTGYRSCCFVFVCNSL